MYSGELEVQAKRKAIAVLQDEINRILNAARSLATLPELMIQKQSVKDATIFVDPTEDVVRIYGKWKTNFEFGITKELFEIYDKIAGHIKSL